LDPVLDLQNKCITNENVTNHQPNAKYTYI